MTWDGIRTRAAAPGPGVIRRITLSRVMWSVRRVGIMMPGPEFGYRSKRQGTRMTLDVEMAANHDDAGSAREPDVAEHRANSMGVRLPHPPGPASAPDNWWSMLLIAFLVIAGVEALRRTSLAHKKTELEEAEGTGLDE
jgi:hypothetical protein